MTKRGQYTPMSETGQCLRSRSKNPSNHRKYGVLEPDPGHTHRVARTSIFLGIGVEMNLDAARKVRAPQFNQLTDHFRKRAWSIGNISYWNETPDVVTG